MLSKLGAAVHKRTTYGPTTGLACITTRALTTYTPTPMDSFTSLFTTLVYDAQAQPEAEAEAESAIPTEGQKISGPYQIQANGGGCIIA